MFIYPFIYLFIYLSIYFTLVKLNTFSVCVCEGGGEPPEISPRPILGLDP